MKKVLDLLEEHVQWLMVGIAALFLGWAVWSYLVSPSWATVERNSSLYAGGQLDEATKEGPAAALEQKMRSNSTVEIKVPELAGQFAQQLAASGGASLPDKWVVVPARPPEGLIGNRNAPPPIEQVRLLTPLPPNVRVAALPASLPKPTPIAISSGISNVADPSDASADPNDPNNPGVEKQWATISFSVNVAELASQFSQAGLPPVAQSMFLQVETERQERGTDGSWGASAVIPYIKATQQGLDRPDYPEAQPANQIAQFRAVYLQWAMNATQEILQPGFYRVISGVPWEVPGIDQIAGAAAGAGEFRPENFLGIPPSQWPASLTEAQRAEIRRLIAERAREEQRNRRPPPGAGGGGGGRGGRGGEGLPAQVAPPRGPRGGFPPPGFGGEGGYVPPGEEGMFPPGEGGIQDPGRPDLGPAVRLPNGLFMLRDWQQVIGWAHDENVKSEKTYRYRVRYKILSPVYNLVRNVQNPRLAEQFDITSEWSDWQEVTVQPRSSFFIAGTFGASSSAIKVDVFKWENGGLTSSTFTVAIGDPIGKLSGGLDYGTGWYLADIRQDTGNNSAYALFINRSGQTLRRTATGDSADPNYSRLKNLIANPTAGGLGQPR